MMKQVLGRTTQIFKIDALVSVIVKITNEYNYNLYIPQFFFLAEADTLPLVFN